MARPLVAALDHSRNAQTYKCVLDDEPRVYPSGENYPLSTPGRLPVETWMEVVGEYSSKKEWLALCRTSRFFHRLARIGLYKRLDFDTLEESKRIIKGDPRSSVALFAKTFQARPELGALIRDLTLRIYTQHKDCPCAFVLSKISQLPNLERLVIKSSILNAEFRDAVYSRPRLRALELDGCILDSSLVTPCTQDFPQSSIVDLKLFTVQCGPSVPDRMWATFVPAGLRSLDFTDHSIPDCANNPILSSIVAPGNALEKLKLTHVPLSITQLLVASPRLRHLVFYKTSGVGCASLLSSLPGDAIPLLESYHGPAHLSPIFLRNRPVYSVTLSHMENLEKSECITMLDSLKISSVPVTRLVLYCTLEEHWFPHMPITMTHLKFYINHKEDLKTPSLLPALSRLAGLRSICIVPLKSSTHTRFTRKEIFKISAKLPSLREIVIWWNEGRWRTTEPNVWEKFEHLDNEYVS